MRKLLRVLEPIALVLVLAVLMICAIVGYKNTALFTSVVAIGAAVIFLAHFESVRPKPRDFMSVVVMAALASAGRVIFMPFPSIQPVTAIVVVGGVSFGRHAGFLIGALAALASNLFFGQGPWTPWQMYAWGLVGYLAGVLAERGAFKHLWTVYIFGFLSALFYGFILDSWSIFGFIHPTSLETVFAGYAAGFAFNLPHAISTVFFLLPILYPWTKKLDRLRVKYGLGLAKAYQASDKKVTISPEEKKSPGK